MLDATFTRSGLARIWRVAALTSAVAVAATLLGTCAYCVGVWPHRIEVSIDGPPGWRLVRVGDRVQDSALPTRATQALGWIESGREVTCALELGNGSERARGRVRAWDGGNLVSGYQAIPCGAESLDGSLWLHDAWRIEVQAPRPGELWFGCTTWGKASLQVDGEAREPAALHACTLAAETEHAVAARGWSVWFAATAGTTVHVAEWGSPSDTVVRCDDAGWSHGTLHVDGVAVSSFVPSTPMKVTERAAELHLTSLDGGVAKLRLARLGEVRLTLRVSR